MSHDPNPIPPPGPDEPPAEGVPEHDRPPGIPMDGVLFEEDRPLG
jgi:hypothetical protein